MKHASTMSTVGNRRSPKIPKYQRICNELTRAIKAGEYGPGDQLPTERELADRFQVHRMTIRQATAAMVKAGLVTKRRPAGVFVRPDWPQQVAAQRMHLIANWSESTMTAVFLEHGAKTAAQNGFRPRVLSLYPGDEQLAIDAACSMEPAILMGIDIDTQAELGQAIRQAADRVVIVGQRMDHLGVASVVGDDELGMALAVEHLRELGHETIALVCATDADRHPTQEIQIQYWRRAVMDHRLTARQAEKHLIRLRQQPSGGAAVYAFAAVNRYLSAQGHQRATAFIALSEEAAQGAAAAMYQHRLSIPQDVSIVAYCGTHRSQLMNPPMTAVDMQLEAHIDAAIEHLIACASEDPDDHPGENERLVFIRPRLIRRNSCGPRKGPRKDPRKDPREDHGKDSGKDSGKNPAAAKP